MKPSPPRPTAACAGPTRTAADVEDGRRTLEAVRRACAAAPRSAAASRQDRASRRRVDPSAWFELALRGQAPPFAAAGDDTIEVAHPRVLAAIVALKRGVELLAGPKGSYASSRWQKRSFRLPQLYAFEWAGTEARGKYMDALAAAAKPLAAGDHVLLCEESGGASTRPCTVMNCVEII